MPVLMYHSVAAGDAGALARWRVAPDAFEEQLRLLRRHGCYALSVEALGWYHARGEAVPGRPVVITFDDGFRDLVETAWPILYRNAMIADVFVVTDRVGAQSDWDRRLGEPQLLLDWSGLATLHAQGLGVHSHLASHRHVDSLTTRELLNEAVASRETIARRLSGEVRALAPPYGGSDERAVRLFDAAGYHLGFTTENGMASLDDHSLRLPRIEIHGDMTIAQFAEAVGLA
ncbi:polysaccharide deacetylase family protein [Sphingomonas sp. LR60]|uniref:polysaccharide deacetylase family protein n=1 Tax=Sphingomonas sp. LR60 TaxID=3050233 RepID=UPI002FDFB3E7